MAARAATRPALHGGLSTVEYFTFGFGTMIGVGWLVLMDDWLARGGPGGGMLGYLVGGLAGAAVATVAIFTPIYLGVIVPGPWFVRHRDNPQVKAFVRGATAAAAGAIAGATVAVCGSLHR